MHAEMVQLISLSSDIFPWICTSTSEALITNSKCTEWEPNTHKHNSALATAANHILGKHTSNGGNKCRKRSNLISWKKYFMHTQTGPYVRDKFSKVLTGKLVWWLLHGTALPFHWGRLFKQSRCKFYVWSGLIVKKKRIH